MLPSTLDHWVLPPVHTKQVSHSYVIYRMSGQWSIDPDNAHYMKVLRSFQKSPLTDTHPHPRMEQPTSFLSFRY